MKSWVKRMKHKHLKKQLMHKPIELSPKQIQKMKDDATMQAVNITNILPLLVLRDEFGFGKKRLQQYIDALNRQLDAFNGGHISLKDVVGTINAETGLGYMEEVEE